MRTYDVNPRQMPTITKDWFSYRKKSTLTLLTYAKVFFLPEPQNRIKYLFELLKQFVLPP